MAVTLGDVYNQQQQMVNSGAYATEMPAEALIEGAYIKRINGPSSCPVPKYDNNVVGDQWKCNCGIRHKFVAGTRIDNYWKVFYRDRNMSHTERMKVIDALVGKG